MEIFKLAGSIFVDSDAADKSLQKTDKKAQGVGTTLANGIKTAGKWAAGLTTAAVGAGTAITAFAMKSAGTADEVDKMSQKLGMSREGYQEWDYVLSQAGVEITSMTTGLKTLTNKIDDAKNGSKGATEMFGKLGISLDDLNGMSREDAFDAVIESMQGMEDSTTRAALANDLFGKSGQELTALFNESAEGTENLKNKAHELGMVMSDETVDAGVNLTDTVDTLKRSFGGIFAQLGGKIMPLVTKVADFIIDHMPEIQSVLDTLSPVVTQLFDGIVPPLMDMASQIFPQIVDLINQILPLIIPIIQELMPIFSDILSKILPVITDIVSTLLPPLLTLLQPIIDLLQPVMELLDPILQLVTGLLDPIVTLINELLNPLIQIITKLINSAITPLKSVFGALANLLTGVVTSAVESMVSRFNNIKNIFTNIIDFIKNVFTGNWEGAWENVKKIFSNIWEGIKTAFKMPINWIIDGINLFVRGINKIKIPDWVPAVGGKGFSIKEIPNLYQGGVLEKGQTAFLEGSGAEAVVPLQNNRKWISAVAEDMKAAGIGGSDAVVDLLNDISDSLKNIVKSGITLDGDVLVGGIADKMDKALGRIQTRKVRT